jgi:hypothetical protein
LTGLTAAHVTAASKSGVARTTTKGETTVSVRNKFIGIAGACAMVAAVGCAASGAQAEICNPCSPAVQLWIQGTQGNQSVLAPYAGANQVDFRSFPFLGPPSEPAVTFQGNASWFQGPVQVQATDTLSCVTGAGGNPVSIRSDHYTSFALGSVSVTYQPSLRCPAGYSIWASDQTARAVDTYGHATPLVGFNWGLLGN